MTRTTTVRIPFETKKYLAREARRQRTSIGRLIDCMVRRQRDDKYWRRVGDGYGGSGATDLGATARLVDRAAADVLEAGQ